MRCSGYSRKPRAHRLPFRRARGDIQIRWKDLRRLKRLPTPERSAWRRQNCFWLHHLSVARLPIPTGYRRVTATIRGGNPAKTIEGSEVAPHGARGPGHVAFAVPKSEMDEWKKHLKAKGVEIEKDVLWPNGGRSLYFRDPVGNCLELASPLVWGMEEVGSSSRIP